MVENPTAELLRKATSGVKSCQANKKGRGGGICFAGSIGSDDVSADIHLQTPETGDFCMGRIICYEV